MEQTAHPFREHWTIRLIRREGYRRSLLGEERFIGSFDEVYRRVHALAQTSAADVLCLRVGGQDAGVFYAEDLLQ